MNRSSEFSCWCLVFACIVALCFVPGEGSLTSISTAVSTAVLDRINVDQYLRNQRMVESHINCLLYNPSVCDTVGNEVKRLVPTMGPRQCQACTPQQKQKLRKILQHWQRYYPQAFKDLQRMIKSGQIPV